MSHRIEKFPTVQPKIITFVTVFDYPSNMIPTVKALLSYEQWLDKEAERVSRMAPCAIVRNRSGDQIALAIIE